MLVAGEQGGLSFFDEALVTDPYAILTRNMTQASLVGQSTVRGKKTDHVVLASPSVELQDFWLDATTGLPARVVAVYADHPLRPHFSVDYFEWKLDQKLPASTFALPRPKGATQVEFRAAAAAFR